MTEEIPQSVLLAEERCAGVSLMLSRDDLASVHLTGSDFYQRTCGDIWDAALSMDVPSPLLLMDRDPQLAVEYARLAQRCDMAYFSREWLQAHVPLIRRESAKRARLGELAAEAGRVGRGELAEPWWQKYYEETA